MVDENAPHRLVVEGEDDKHSVIHLMKRHGVDFDTPHPRTPYVHVAEGYPGVLESVRVSIRAYKKLGFILDANDNLEVRWAQIKGRFDREEVALPDAPAADGIIIDGALPDSKVGVWLMPDNSHPGALEEFLSDLIPETDVCWAHAEKATHEAKALGATFPDNAFLKARIHAWLSWQEEPGLPYGSAIKAEYLESESNVAAAFTSWFRRLFFDSPQ